MSDQCFHNASLCTKDFASTCIQTNVGFMVYDNLVFKIRKTEDILVQKLDF